MLRRMTAARVLRGSPMLAVERIADGVIGSSGHRREIDGSPPRMCISAARRACVRPAATKGARVGTRARAGIHVARLRGFSLLEILVVMVILAVAIGAVTLAMGGSGERVLTREAERTQALVEFACERAQLSGRDIGISVSQGGFRFSRFDGGVWLPYREEALRARNWPGSLAVALERDQQVVRLDKGFPDRPQLLCYASGELTAFRLDLALPDLDKHYRLDGLGDGHVRLTAVDAHAR
jgi:general secretion pathway protein H